MSVFRLIMSLILLAFSSLCSTKPMSAIEGCPEIIGNGLTDSDNIQQKQFECHNPIALITTLCDALSRSNGSEQRMNVQSTCPTAKLVVSFFEGMMNDVIIRTESIDTCYDRGKMLNDVILTNPTTIKMLDFIIEIIDAYQLKIVIIILDSSTALPAKQLQRRLNMRPIKSVVANLDNPSFNLEDALTVWSNSHNFLVFCNRVNQIRLIQAANRSGLFGDPYFWIFEEGDENNATQAFKEFNVEYVWNVNIAKILNNASQMISRKRAVVTKVDFRNVDDQKLSELRQSCATRNFSTWTRTSSKVRRKTDESHILHDYSVLGYELFRMHLKCFGTNGIQLQSMGKWTTDKSLEINLKISRSVNLSMRGCHFKVGIVDNTPSTILAAGAHPNTTVGGDVELLQILAEKSEFTFEFVESNESSVGNLLENGWTGLIRLLVDEQIDMILPAMAITKKREEYMDFSATIRDVSTVIVIKKPGIDDDIFSDYTQPFEKNVWIMLGLTLLTAVVGLTFTHLFSPYGARLAHLRHGRDVDLNWWNSFYALNSIMVQQGVDRTPTSISGKIVFASFLLAAMILMQNYSSLLVSFLTVNKPLVPFSTLEELTQCEDYSIGLVEGSSLVEVFSTSNEPVRKRLWEKIENQGLEKSILPDLDEALKKVIKEKIALLIRSTAVHDILLTNCSFHAALKDVIKVSYHIAVRKGFAYNNILSQHITRLRETGFLDKLKNKYSLPGHNSCKSDKLSAISIDHVYFLLCILAAGFLLTLLSFVFERLVHLRYGERGLNLMPGTVDIARRNMVSSKEVLVDAMAIKGDVTSRMPTSVYRYVIKVENLLKP